MAHIVFHKKVVVGLGNPGLTYRYNRHNCGYLVVETIARHQRLHLQTVRKLYKWATFKSGDEAVSCTLCLPLTYMNNSGIAVRQILSDFAIPPADLLVVVDDIDLPLGRLRLRAKGSAGGHRGLQSIIQHLGTTEFARLRLGIGPQGVNQPAEEFVLSDFRPEEKELLRQVIAMAAECVLEWTSSDLRQVMNKYNALNLTQPVEVTA